MDVFKGQNLLEFSDWFKTDENCKKYLAEIKWKDGLECVKCGHKKAQIKKDYSRTCNICSHQESATSNTLFHKVKFGVRKAFSSHLKWVPAPRVSPLVIWVSLRCD